MMMKALLACCACFVPLALQAAPGSLDLTYGGSGAGRALGIGVNAYEPEMKSTVLSDGSVIVVYECSGGTSATLCIEKLDPNGIAVTTFGVGGVQSLAATAAQHDDPIGVFENGATLVVLSTCKRRIVNADYVFCATLLSAATGALSPLLGADGTRFVSFASLLTSSEAVATLGADGLIHVAYACEFTGKGVVRTTCLSRIDLSGFADFAYRGGEGFLPLDPAQHVTGANPWIQVSALATRPDASVHWVGVCGSSSQSGIVCGSQVQPSGFALTSSGGDGRMQDWPALILNASEVAIQADGKLLVAGRCAVASPRDCVVRFHADLSLDSGFATAGVYYAARQAPAGAMTLARPKLHIRDDGRIALFSLCRGSVAATYPSLCVYRIHLTGESDASFGVDGLTTYEESSGPSSPNARPAYIPVSAYAARASNQNRKHSRYTSIGICVPAQCSATACTYSYAEARSCAVRVENGSYDHRTCNGDIDGDGVAGTAQDQLLFARSAIGFRGNNVANADTFLPAATRNTWPAIRDYLAKQCGVRVAP
jgi:hypothetical protein